MIGYLSVALLVVFGISYFLGKSRSLALVKGDSRRLHSLPGYHGLYLAFWAILPSCLLALIWAITLPRYINARLRDLFSDVLAHMSIPEQESFLRDASAIAHGGIVSNLDEVRQSAGATITSISSNADMVLVLVATMLVLGGFYYAWSEITPAKRTRHVVERIGMVALSLPHWLRF